MTIALEGRLRQDLTGMEARLTSQLTAARVEFITWSCVLWMGQLLVNLALLSAVADLIR